MNKQSNLIKYRKELKLTQAEMAEAFGITQSAYNQKEQGKTRFSTEEMLVIKILIQKIKPDVTIDEIFFSD